MKIDIVRCTSLKEIEEKLFPVLDSYGYLLPASKDARILLKPNLNSNMNALTGNTTDLRILSALIRYLKENGYRNITIGEGTNSGFYRYRIGVISRLRVDELARYYGAGVKDLNYSEPHAVEFEDGVTAHVARDCVEADLLINIPKLKTHFEAGMSVCLKSLMGCLVGQENKKKTHRSLAANILRINRVVKPHLQIVDGMVAMEGLGPTRGTPVALNTILVGTDPYLLDLACARIAEFDWRSVTTLKLAAASGLLTRDHHRFVESLDLHGIQRKFKPPKANPFAAFIHSPVRQKYFLAIRNTPLFTYLASTDWFGKLLFWTGLRQDVFTMDEMTFRGISLDTTRCDGCGLCNRYCPLGSDLPRGLRQGGEECIGCLYCYMVCPHEAIELDGELGFLREQLRQYDKIVRNMHHERKKAC